MKKMAFFVEGQTERFFLEKLIQEYAKGCDVYVTEMQASLVAISSGVQGVPPFLGRYTIDTHHTPGYAAGYMANQV